MKLMGVLGARAFFAVTALTWVGCDSSTPSPALGASGSAGASGNSADNEGDAGLGGSGAGGGVGGNVSTAGGPGDFDACNSVAVIPPADAGDVPEADPHQLGLLTVTEPITVEGQVSAIAADRMLITTAEGTLTFFWMGPSLESAFSVDDAVQVVVEDPDAFAFLGPLLSIVRSENATAAIFDSQPMTGLGKSPGSTRSLTLSPGFPELVYGVKGCRCWPLGGAARPYQYNCDYSLLDTLFEGVSVPVALGATGLVGPWSVTNIRSNYREHIEDTWSLAVSLLGPATPRAADGGT